MTDTTERAEPMKGLAERLRECADEVMEFPHPSHCDHLHDAASLMREAASEVEAARQRPAAQAASPEPVATLSIYMHEGRRVDDVEWEHLRATLPIGEYRLCTATPTAERPAAPAQAGVTNEQIEQAVREAFPYVFGHYRDDPRIEQSFDKLRATLGVDQRVTSPDNNDNGGAER
jgi:hypothetical protein